MIMPTVLIIEREPQFREACKMALRRAGFRVIAKVDIVDGLQMLDGLRLDLIVWDLYPRKIIGKKTLSVLREKYGDIPLILMVPEKELYDDLSKMAEAVLVKSNEMDDLLTKIVALLKASSVKQRELWMSKTVTR